MRSLFFARPGFKRLVSSALMGIGAAAIGGNALADVSSWVSTTAPDIVPDPGAAGPLSTMQIEYTGPTGQHGLLVMPTDAAADQEAVKRPVVVFLHGDHATCLIDRAPSQPVPYTNCPVDNRVLNYTGYLYIQRRLATKGYISISIDANNLLPMSSTPDFHKNYDEITDKHLSLLSSWADSAPSAFLMWASRNADLNNVVLVGHSIGAEHVNNAALLNKNSQINGTPNLKWRVTGQVLISGDSNPLASTVGVHTLRWMSACDGIPTTNAMGQQLIDSEVHHDQKTLRAAVLVRGANHNYSNSVWTDDDDEYGTQILPFQEECRLKDASGQPFINPPTRLSPSAQRAAVSAYVTAAVTAFASDDKNAWNAIDGTPGHMLSSGPSGITGPEIRVSAKGRRRNDLTQFTAEKLSVSGSPNIVATICNSNIYAINPCLSGTTYPLQRNSYLIGATGQFGGVNRVLASVKWSTLSPDSKVSIQYPLNPDNSRQLLEVMVYRKQLGLRIAQPASTGTTTAPSVSMSVQLRDNAGHTIDLGKVTFNPLASKGNYGPIWAQEVHIPIPSSPSFDFTSIISLDLMPLSPDSGQFWVVDAFGYAPN
jgi:hypothetical protein